MNSDRVVSVIVPCRNERAHIAAFCDALLAQRLDAGVALEVIVADGGSDDGTRAWLQDHCARHPGWRWLHNPGRIVSTGLNLAIQAATGAVIVRMDVHTTYADDYITSCLRVLQATGATCVGGAWRPVGDGWPRAAIVRAFESRFGSGGAASRRAHHDGPVDTVYLGAWRREDLLRLGGFDEQLVRNQDDELSLRIVRGGGTVWQSASIRSWYTPRASFAALYRQFYQYGYWKVAVIRKHRLPAAPRHLAPFAWVAVLALTALAGFAWTPAWWALGVLLGVYAAATLANAVMLAKAPHRVRDTLGISIATSCMHTGYGLGFARALADLLGRRAAPRRSAVDLTR